MGLDGTVTGIGHAGPSNPITIGVDEALKNIIVAVDNARPEPSVEFKASVMGLAGASRSYLGDELLSYFPTGFGETCIVSDARSALAGATGCKPGVVIISGTGSIAYGENASGEKARAGGWGWRLGDEGSGYTIGNNALIAALRAYDRSGPETILTDMILNYLGLSQAEDVIDWTYDPMREPRHFAALVPLVKEAENKGDLVATRIMSEAGAQLGSVAQAVIRRLRLTGDFPVACCGGVFKQPNRYNEFFEETVRDAAPDCVFIEPLFTPTVGSALLALQKIGVTISEDLLDNVEKSLRRFNE